MITLGRWIVGLIVRRFRWVAVGALFRAVTRRNSQRTVDEATAELSDRLPESVTTALASAPGDVLRVGGTALAAGRRARRAVSVSRSVSRTAGDAASRAAQAGSTAAGFVDAARSATESFSTQARLETDRAKRQLWSDYHRSTGDIQAADEALLDHRGIDLDADLPEVPPAVPAGRRRAVDRAKPLVNRVQRSYRRRELPWNRSSDRPGR